MPGLIVIAPLTWGRRPVGRKFDFNLRLALEGASTSAQACLQTSTVPARRVSCELDTRHRNGRLVGMGVHRPHGRAPRYRRAVRRDRHLRHALGCDTAGNDGVRRGLPHEVEGRRLTFLLLAHDGVDPITERTHERFVIERARFAGRPGEAHARPEPGLVPANLDPAGMMIARSRQLGTRSPRQFDRNLIPIPLGCLDDFDTGSALCLSDEPAAGKCDGAQDRNGAAERLTNCRHPRRREALHLADLVDDEQLDSCQRV